MIRLRLEPVLAVDPAWDNTMSAHRALRLALDVLGLLEVLGVRPSGRPPFCS